MQGQHCLAHRVLQVRGGNFLPLDEAFHQFVVKFAQTFDHVLPLCLDVGCDCIWHGQHLKIHPKPCIVFLPDISLLGNEIDNPGERVLFAERILHDEGG